MFSSWLEFCEFCLNWSIGVSCSWWRGGRKLYSKEKNWNQTTFTIAQFCWQSCFELNSSCFHRYKNGHSAKCSRDQKNVKIWFTIIQLYNHNYQFIKLKMLFEITTLSKICSKFGSVILWDFGLPPFPQLSKKFKNAHFCWKLTLWKYW